MTSTGGDQPFVFPREERQGEPASMRLRLLTWIALAIFSGGYVHPITAPAQETSSQQALLNRYCVTCHNEKLRTAELLLDKAGLGNAGAKAEIWEKVVRKLRGRAMPPPGVPRPDEAEYDSLVTYLETALDRVAAASPNPGRTVDFHRLNRSEYTNAVRDLLAVEIDGAAMLPDDDADYGFDNVGDALSVSPLLMERYLAVAERISQLAVGDPEIGVDSETYNIPVTFMQDDRMGENMPLGSRGGFAVQHNFSLDGEYAINIRLQRNQDGYIRGLLDQVHPLEVRVDGKRIAQFPVGGVRKGTTGPIHSRIGGQYRFDPEQMEHEIVGADAGLEVRFPAKAGNHLVQVFFLKRNISGEGLLEYFPVRPMEADFIDFKGGEPRVKLFTISGPFDPTGPGNTLSRRRIFVCHPGSGDAGMDGGGSEAGEQELACARKIIGRLARRAYRRPVGDREIQPLLRLYSLGRAGGGLQMGVQRALQGILVSPQFLFRAERDPEGVSPDTPYEVSDLDLASRLSFFLWSSIPDEKLLELAESGKLRKPAVLERQVRRMLADPKSETLISNFAAQWLYLRNLNHHFPDGRAFPDFDDELRQAFQQETELFLKSMLREDRPATELLDADYTFVNERLALHYGIPDIYGSNFRRLSVSDENRRGLLGQGSILTLTSRPNRTSPVLRGKWVLNNLFGTPPPAPPPNIPALPENSRSAKPTTVRQRLEEHRVNPVCSSCHAQMDPIGFALENFDATGRWRNDDGGAPIDASGTLPSGSKFIGPGELREILLSRPELFVHNVTEKLLTYALGRGVQHYDQPAVRGILRDAAADDYRWSSLILGIVKSTPFQMRRSRPL